MEDKCYASVERYITRVDAASDTSTFNAENESEDGDPNEGLAGFSGVPTSDYHATMVFCTIQVCKLKVYTDRTRECGADFVVVEQQSFHP